MAGMEEQFDKVGMLEQALRSAALACIHGREGREQSVNATQTYPVFLVRIARSAPGRLVTEAGLTSFPD